MRRYAALLLAACLIGGAGPRVVRHVGTDRVVVTTPQGTGDIPLYATADWSQPQPAITRAVLVIHGLNRNADRYFADAQKAQAAAGAAGATALMLAPQFLANQDIAANHLSPEMLHWATNDWSAGKPAHGPIPASAFDALDAILARLANRAVFPKLTEVVVAGHSAGGQVVQRYAVAGRGEAALTAIGVHVRYVVANPSSYAYFTPDRPLPGGGFGRFAGAAACPAFDQWKYGFAGGLPPYLQGTAANLEQRYAARDVVMLLGGADNDPQLKVLDKSCSGEAEGTDHLSRGLAYAAYLRARGHAAAPFVIPGVGHDGGRMFGSACGLAALFDRPGCATP
jgi:hypothetical protein